MKQASFQKIIYRLAQPQSLEAPRPRLLSARGVDATGTGCAIARDPDTQKDATQGHVPPPTLDRALNRDSRARDPGSPDHLTRTC